MEEKNSLKIYTRDDHELSRKKIDPDALKIMYRLNRNGFRGYLVGGGVRDVLLGKSPKDFDIATDATPRQIKNLFRNSRIIGRRFKLVHIYFRDNKIVEVATFRSEDNDLQEEKDENQLLMLPKDNTYGDEQSDALRRDITINALFYDIDSFSIIDYVGGVQDLRDKVVKVIGNPFVRLPEDPVRMLRVLRHAARANFSISETTQEAIRTHGPLIQECPDMRIYEEFKKDLLSGYSLPTLRLFQGFGLLRFILPEIDDMREELHADDSPLAMALHKADAHYRITGGELITPVLCLLAIVAHPVYKKDKRFIDCLDEEQSTLSEYLETCFHCYAVPRRERERIYDTLSALLLLEQKPYDEINPSKLPHDIRLKQLITLVKFLEHLPQRSELLGFLKGVRKTKKEQRSKHRKRNRSRRHSSSNRSRRSQNRAMPGSGKPKKRNS